LEELVEKTVCETSDYKAVISEETIKAIIENKCYYMLEKIRDIIKDDETSDKECFDKIEEIVCLFEKMGIDFGSRHDFG
jgi:hypothetical protein